MWWRDPFAALDTETTGLSWDDDRIIQVGVSYFAHGKFVATNEWLINSGACSAPEALATHGITDEMQLEDGELPQGVYPLLKMLIQEQKFLVIMNAPFDVNFLISEFNRLGISVKFPYILDPLVIDRFYSSNRIPSIAGGRRTLKALSERFGIFDYPLHSAGHDSRRVGELMIEMAQRHGQLSRTPLSELHKKQRVWNKNWCDQFASFADAKGFSFTAHDWPQREATWQAADQLPLEYPRSPIPTTVRRARPASQ